MKIKYPEGNNITALKDLRPLVKSIPYIREERNGFWSLLTYNGDPNYSMLNKTGHMVLELCDGVNDPLDILSRLSAVYPEVSAENLQYDLLKILLSLTQTNTIEWRNKKDMSENPFPITAATVFSDGTFFSLVMEHEIRELSEFLSDVLNAHEADDGNSCYVWGENHAEYLDPLVIRQCLYSYYKDFFVLKRDGLIIGAIIVHPSIESYLNGADIQFVSIPSDSLISALKEVSSYYAQFPYKKINYMQIRMPKAFVQANNEFVSNLLSAGYIQESVRKHAYLNEDLITYLCEINV